MSKFVDILRDEIPNDFFSDKEVQIIFDGSRFGSKERSSDSRYALIKRAIAHGEIIHLRRGLYAFVQKYQRQGLNLFELAQKIYAPSYISLESAMSFHGLIPEGAPTVTSVSLRRSRDYSTPLGVFSYSRIPAFNFIGVERIAAAQSVHFLATAVKAVVDYVYVYRKEWAGSSALMESLRISPQNLALFSKEVLRSLLNVYRHKRVERFIISLIEELES
jgi:hypothetical protein